MTLFMRINVIYLYKNYIFILMVNGTRKYSEFEKKVFFTSYVSRFILIS